MHIEVSDLRKAKVRQGHREAEMKVRRLGSKRMRRHEKGYTWTMGYNNCVGRYSADGNYSRFGGSSLNRTKQLKLYDEENLYAVTANYLKVVVACTKDAVRKWGGWPIELCDVLIRQDVASQEAYRLRIQQQVGGDVLATGLGIHMLSPRSRGKIKDKATAFFRASPGNRVFCTLTFIAAVDDRTGVTILNKFLTSLRKKYENLQFLWVAERQKNNVKYPGNIHFHMILNKRLPVGQWNAMWVLQQYNSGLIGEDRYDQSVSKETIMDAYALDYKEGFRKKRIQAIFNPFDIKPVKSIGGLSNYLTKYITKQDKDEPFGCATWHCSRRVSRMFTRTTVGPSAFAYMKSFANYKVDKQTGECWPAMEVKGAFFVMIYAFDKTCPLRYLKEMEQANRWILEGMSVSEVPKIDDDDYRKYFISKN